MVDRRAHAARLAVAVLVACAALSIPPASAQRADEAEREYRLGYQALQAGDCAEAIVHYRRSLDLRRRPRTLFNMAVCQEELGLQVDAWHSYHAFLDLAEARDATIVVKARARIAALRAVLRGKVTVESSPPGASVHVDGERQARGVTPLTLALEPGRHTVRLVMRDAVPVERTVEVAPDGVEGIAVALELPSTITIVAEPDDATIEPEGGAASIGTYEAPAAPGRHAFTVRRDGYLSERLEIEAVAGRSHVERVRLRPLPSRAALRPDAAHLAPGENVTVDLATSRASSTRRSLGWGLGGLGVAGLAGGGVVGVLALRDVTGPEDVHDRGKRRAWLADGLIVVGTVAVVAAWRLLRERPRPATITREGAR